MTRSLMCFVALLMISLGHVTDARAGSKVIQLSLVPSIQIFDETTDIGGVRIMIYGQNRNVTGLDFGLGGRVTGDFVGLQWMIVGLIDGVGKGWQSNYAYNRAGTFYGIQSGVVNQGDDMTGFQLGFVNYNRRMSGFSLSIVNYAEELDGLQIGLLNIAKNAKGHSILPIVNWVF